MSARTAAPRTPVKITTTRGPAGRARPLAALLAALLAACAGAQRPAGAEAAPTEAASPASVPAPSVDAAAAEPSAAP